MAEASDDRYDVASVGQGHAGDRIADDHADGALRHLVPAGVARGRRGAEVEVDPGLKGETAGAAAGCT